MTTAFELASTANAYQPWSISRVVTADAVANSLGHVDTHSYPVHSVSSLQSDSADFSESSAFAAAAVRQQDAQAARVESIRQSIADGTYSVSATKVAGSLIEAMLWEW